MALRLDRRARRWYVRAGNRLPPSHPASSPTGARPPKRWRPSVFGATVTGCPRCGPLGSLPPSERGGQLTERAVYYLVRTAGEQAGLRDLHPHTLRHSCGYYLAHRGTDLRTMQDYLGHRDPKHTVKYTPIAGRRFEGLWK